MALDPRKESMLEDWAAVRNAILRAVGGEMKVTHLRPAGEPATSENVIGVAVDLELYFGRLMPVDFTEEEKEAVRKAADTVLTEEKTTSEEKPTSEEK